MSSEGWCIQWESPSRAPATLEQALAAEIQRLCDCEPDAGYVKRLQDSVDDAELLLGCLRSMVARGELYEGGDLLYSKIQYLCRRSDGPFGTARRAEPDDRWGGPK